MKQITLALLLLLIVNAQTHAQVTYYSPTSLALPSTPQGVPSASRTMVFSATGVPGTYAFASPTGFVELSIDDNTFSSNISLSTDTSGRIEITTIFIRLSSSAPLGTIADFINISLDGLFTESYLVTGNVESMAPVAYAIPSVLGFTAVPNSPSAAQPVSIFGENFSGPLIVNTSGNFEISSDSLSFSSSLELPGTGGLIYVRMMSGTSKNEFGELMLMDNSVFVGYVALTGMRIFPPISIGIITPNPIVRGMPVSVSGANFFDIPLLELPGKTIFSGSLINSSLFTFIFPANYPGSTVTLTFTGQVGDRHVRTMSVVGEVSPPLISTINPPTNAFLPIYLFGSNLSPNTSIVNVGEKRSPQILGVENNVFVTLPEGFTKGKLKIVDTLSKLQAISSNDCFLTEYEEDILGSHNINLHRAVSVPAGSHTFWASDFNHDQFMDVVVLGQSPNQLTFLSAPQFQLQLTIPLSNAYRNGLLSDMNNDGFSDIVLYDSLFAQVAIYLNTSARGGAISFNTIPHIVPTVEIVRSLVVHDFDRDGKLDLLALGNSGNLSFFLNNTLPGMVGYSSTPQIVNRVSHLPKELALMDYDLDGKVDVVYTSANNPGTNYVLRNNTTATGQVLFDANPSFPGHYFYQKFKDAFLSGTYFANQIIGADSANKLISITQYDGSVFTTNTIFYSFTPGNFDTGNFNGDMYNDLAVCFPDNGVVRIFQSTVVGFMPDVIVTVGGIAADVLVEDIDNNNKPDLIVLNTGTNQLQVFRNNIREMTDFTILGTSDQIATQNGLLRMWYTFAPAGAKDTRVVWSATPSDKVELPNNYSYFDHDTISVIALDNGVVTVTATNVSNPEMKRIYVITITGQIPPPRVATMPFNINNGEHYFVKIVEDAASKRLLARDTLSINTDWDLSGSTVTIDNIRVRFFDANVSAPDHNPDIPNAQIMRAIGNYKTYYSKSVGGVVFFEGSMDNSHIIEAKEFMYNPAYTFSTLPKKFAEHRFKIRDVRNLNTIMGIGGLYEYHNKGYGFVKTPDRNTHVVFKTSRFSLYGECVEGCQSGTKFTKQILYYDQVSKFPLVEVNVKGTVNRNPITWIYEYVDCDTTVYLRDDSSPTGPFPTISGIRITYPSRDTTLSTGMLYQFTAQISPPGADSTAIVWVVSDTNAVIFPDGSFIGLDPGIVRVTAYYAFDPFISDSRNIQLVGMPVVTVSSFTIHAVDEIKTVSPLDSVVTLIPIFQPASATNQNVLWSMIPDNTVLGLVSLRSYINPDGEIIPSTAFIYKKGQGPAVITIVGRSEFNRNLVSYWVVSVTGPATLRTDVSIKSSGGTDPCVEEVVLEAPVADALSYQWFYNGYRISGARSRTFTPTNSGNYSVRTLSADNNPETFNAYRVTLQSVIPPTILGVGFPVSQLQVTGGTSTGSTFQWYLNNRIIRGQNRISLPVFYNGVYFVTQSLGNCRVRSNDVLVQEKRYVTLQRSGLLVTDSTIENYGEHIESELIKVHPNPTQNGGLIIYKSAGRNEIAYRITNSMGIEIHRGTLKPYSEAYFSDYVDLSPQNKGIYYIFVSEENQKPACIKWVVW